MRTYSDFQPTGFDGKGAFLDTQQDWLVLPVDQTRDSDALSRSNFEIALKELCGERDNICEVHRFGHWGSGWFEIIIINPRAGKTLKKAKSIETALADYPVLDEDHFSETEMNEANEIWSNCYDWRDRLEYIRNNPDNFHFHDFQGLLANVRGEYFTGYASELLV